MEHRSLHGVMSRAKNFSSQAARYGFVWCPVRADWQNSCQQIIIQFILGFTNSSANSICTALFFIWIKNLNFPRNGMSLEVGESKYSALFINHINLQFQRKEKGGRKRVLIGILLSFFGCGEGSLIKSGYLFCHLGSQMMTLWKCRIWPIFGVFCLRTHLFTVSLSWTTLI